MANPRVYLNGEYYSVDWFPKTELYNGVYIHQGNSTDPRSGCITVKTHHIQKTEDGWLATDRETHQIITLRTI